MRKSDVDRLSARDLRFLQALIEGVGITRAGAALGMSQPTASRMVESLRLALGDPLIVRASGRYVLTERAERLRPAVAAALDAWERVLAPEDFDAGTAARVFRLATTDYGASAVVTDALMRIAAVATRIRVEIAPWTEGTLADIEAGALDAALYPDAPLPPDFHAKALFVDDYVICGGRGLAVDDPLAALAERGRIVMLYPDRGMLRADDPLGDAGASPDRIALRTPYFVSAVGALSGTGFVAVLPRRIAVRIGGAALATAPWTASDLSFRYRLIWHERSHRDPGQRWFRSTIA